MKKNKPIMHELIDKFDALELEDVQHERPNGEDFGWLVAIETARESGKTEMLAEKLRSGSPISAAARNWLADLLDGRDLPAVLVMNDHRWSLIVAARDYYDMDTVQWTKLFLDYEAKEPEYLSENQLAALKKSKFDPVLMDRDRRLTVLADARDLPETSLRNFVDGGGNPARETRRILEELISRTAPKGGM